MGDLDQKSIKVFELSDCEVSVSEARESDVDFVEVIIKKKSENSAYSEAILFGSETEYRYKSADEFSLKYL